MKILSILLTFSILFFGSVVPVHATLWDRGGGLIFDDAQNITWLQNANLVVTETFGVEGIDPSSGVMRRTTADAYIAAMNDANYLGYNNWRLPETWYPNSAGTIPGELYYLYIGLGNTPGIGGNDQGSDPVNMTFTDGNGNVVSFQNFVNHGRYFYSVPYWNGAQNFFHFYYGKQYAYWGYPYPEYRFDAHGYVWPVRDGDSTPINNPPSLDPIGFKEGYEEQLLQFLISATDPDIGDVLTFSAANLPEGAVFDAPGATFSWTPTFEQAGNYEDVEFCVTDNGTPLELDCELITITIGNINRPPVISPVSPIDIQEYDPVEFQVVAEDPDYDTIDYSSGALPTGAVFDNVNGFFSWIPTYDQAGTHVITFYATDNGFPVETAELDVVITVADISPMDLSNVIMDMYSDYLSLPNNVLQSYDANMKKVANFIGKGKLKPAINQLQAFISKVEKDIIKGLIEPQDGEMLIGMAEEVVSLLTPAS